MVDMVVKVEVEGSKGTDDDSGLDVQEKRSRDSLHCMGRVHVPFFSCDVLFFLWYKWMIVCM